MSLSFSTQREQIDVTIDDKPYKLRGASGAVAVEFQNIALSGVEWDTSLSGEMKAKKITGVANNQIFLVANTLYEVITNDSGDEKVKEKPVGDAWVRKWLPPKVLKDLFEKAKEISHLDEEETPEQLRKQIEKLQTRLEKLESDEEGE